MRFTSLLKQIILEDAGKIDHLVDTYAKPKKKEDGTIKKPRMSLKELVKLVAADPRSDLKGLNPDTANEKDVLKIKAGRYTPWIIKRYLSINQNTEIPYGQAGHEAEVKSLKERFFEDLYKLTNDLKKFDRFKQRLPEEKRDISKLTVDGLFELVKDFSLEKTKGTREEKLAAVETYNYPGSSVAFVGPNWTVVEIAGDSPQSKDAACFFGGYHLESPKGETNWCTSSPGYDWASRYLKQGPLFVVLPTKWEGKRGEKSGLPSTRYQFHFPSNQFMNPDDRQIDLIKFLNTEGEELKDFFKSEFAKGLVVGDKADRFEIQNFDSGPVAKFIALYGLDDLIDSLPVTIKNFLIVNKKDSSQNINIKIPPSIDRFQNLRMLMLDNCVSSIPDTICNIKTLKFFSVPNNKNLTSIPECIVDLPQLYFLNVNGSPNVKVPQQILDRAAKDPTVMLDDGMFDLSGE